MIKIKSRSDGNIIIKRNKTIILLNWLWGYINYKQSLRLILKADDKNKE